MKRPLNPASIRAPFAQYSHAVEVPPGRMVFASGQLGVAPDDHVPEDAEAQAVLCFENIKAILAEAGMTLADVVRFTAYVTDRASSTSASLGAIARRRRERCCSIGSAGSMARPNVHDLF